MINFTHTSKSYTDRTLWSDFHHTITTGDKIALMGPNGCGKSTMLACITGHDTVDEGSLTTRGLIAHIPQQIPDKYLGFTIQEYRYQYLPSHDELYLGHIAMDDRGVQFDLSTQLRTLSGGQRKIIQLMTLQFRPYDIIILDEPTNHLDIDMKTHLSDYLSSTKAIVVCVTHDRSFINARAQQVRDRDHGQVLTYPGDYGDYLILREQAQLAQQRAHDSVAKELDRQAQVLAEFKRRSTISSSPKRGKMIRTRSKIIQRMQSTQADTVIQDKSISLTASSHTRTGKQLIQIQNMGVNIAGRTLISDINLTIHSGDKIVILGPNGSGKTTFIKQLLQYLHSPGEALKDNRANGKANRVYGSLGLKRSYIDQHNSQISGNTKVIDWYMSKCPGHMPDHVAIRQLMDAGFTHGQMQQTIDTSSHGQKLKLKILTSIKSAVDILILDEPTNHLDIVTIQAVEHMIAQYSGSIIMISHDPYFIANCEIDTIYRICDGSLSKEII